MQLLIVITAKYLYLAILVAAVIVWLRQSRPDKWRMGTLGILAGILALVLVKLAGKIYFDPRPFVVHHIHPLIAHAADNGFPSDHTALTMTTALITYQFSKEWGIALASGSLLVGISRIAAQVHSPIDIIASIVIAAISVVLAKLATPWAVTKLSRVEGLKSHGLV